MTASESFKKIRLELCLNQTELAKALALTVSSISCYERGTRSPSCATIRKAVEFAKKNKLKINYEDFLK
jgi:predicted transcriptional regulator